MAAVRQLCVCVMGVESSQLLMQGGREEREEGMKLLGHAYDDDDDGRQRERSRVRACV